MHLYFLMERTRVHDFKCLCLLLNNHKIRNYPVSCCNNKEKYANSFQARHHVSLRFLLVDDSSTTRKMTNKLLTNRGYNCEEAKDGLDLLHKMGLSIPDAQSAMMYSASGLNKGQEWPVFDVILVDDNMPQLSGPESVTILRNAGYGGLIYGVTGNAFKSQLDNFMTSGADSVFTKPLDFNLLEETIRKALR
mmetsp:Transcript_29877/g.41037  ORF Transcript_29877/g.41037 Transcript_29877/m.41037 type:complete len:192 (+) Transcript_29877:653-1228(+)